MLFFSLSSIMCKHRCHLLAYHSEEGKRGTFFEPPARIQFFESQSRASHSHTRVSESRIKKIFPRLSDFLDRESGKMVCVCGCVWNWKCQQKKGNNVIRRRLGGGGAGGCWENLEKCPRGLRLFWGECRSFSISVWQVAGGRRGLQSGWNTAVIGLESLVGRQCCHCRRLKKFFFVKLTSPFPRWSSWPGGSACENK